MRLRVNNLEWQDVRPVPIGAAKAAAEALGKTITAEGIEGAEKGPFERAAFKVIVSHAGVRMRGTLFRGQVALRGRKCVGEERGPSVGRLVLARVL